MAELTRSNCPNCGAPISAKTCPYCGTALFFEALELAEPERHIPAIENYIPLDFRGTGYVKRSSRIESRSLLRKSKNSA